MKGNCGHLIGFCDASSVCSKCGKTWHYNGYKPLDGLYCPFCGGIAKSDLLDELDALLSEVKL